MTNRRSKLPSYSRRAPVNTRLKYAQIPVNEIVRVGHKLTSCAYDTCLSYDSLIDESFVRPDEYTGEYISLQGPAYSTQIIKLPVAIINIKSAIYSGPIHAGVLKNSKIGLLLGAPILENQKPHNPRLRPWRLSPLKTGKNPSPPAVAPHSPLKRQKPYSAPIAPQNPHNQRIRPWQSPRYHAASAAPTHNIAPYVRPKWQRPYSKPINNRKSRANRYQPASYAPEQERFRQPRVGPLSPPSVADPVQLPCPPENRHHNSTSTENPSPQLAEHSALTLNPLPHPSCRDLIPFPAPSCWPKTLDELSSCSWWGSPILYDPSQFASESTPL